MSQSDMPLAAMSTSLRITEIFTSLQGEAAETGYPTTFVRLTGCPLRCVYCDTAYAFHGGEKTTVDSVHAEVKKNSVERVCVTGGEPLAQPGCLSLLKVLCDDGYQVSLETSGALDISPVDSRVRRVVDVKTPDSGESSKNRLENFQHLRSSDQIKFVLCGRDDYDWSKAFATEHRLFERCEVLFSPSWGELPAEHLAQWMIDDQSKARFQIQLHKFLWNDEPGR